MFANIIIKIVEKLFDHAMQERDDEKIKLYEENRMLTNRARLTSVDELVLSYIERHAPMTFDDLSIKFSKVDCLPKRVTIYRAHGFVTMDKGILSLADKYKHIAKEIAENSTDETVMVLKDDTLQRR